jgi:hypothetical protein
LNNLGNLTVRNRDDDAWPEKRVSIANEDGALFMLVFYVDICKPIYIRCYFNLFFCYYLKIFAQAQICYDSYIN